MTGVRVLVGTQKGAFVLTADGKRDRWEVAGPLFGGWEIYHLTGSPADPERLYASQSTAGSARSSSGPTTGADLGPVGNQFSYEGAPGTHQWYDGTPHPWEFARVWHLEPSPNDPDTVYAGVEDAALFRSTDGGRNWQELPGLRPTDRVSMAAGGGRDVPAHDHDRSDDADRMHVAISAAGVFRTDDGGGLEAGEPRPALRRDP